LEQGPKLIEITPLIGMVLLLLIFFMLTSSSVMYPGIRVNLPRVVTGESGKYQNLEVVISKENAIYINNSAITAQDLKTLLRQVVGAKGSVLIKADKRASLGKIVEIWDACRYSGITQVNIATNQE